MNAMKETIIAMLALSCLAGGQNKESATPYTIQRDVLGESVASFVANNPSCKPRPGSSFDSENITIDNTQTCTVMQTTYAGMPVIGRTVDFYQGRLYGVSLLAPTSECKQFDVLSSLKQKFGQPKSTEIVDGKEMTPAHLGGADLKFWQNGVSTISFQESIGTLDACTISFQLDAMWWKVWQLLQEKEAKKQDLNKKDM